VLRQAEVKKNKIIRSRAAQLKPQGCPDLTIAPVCTTDIRIEERVSRHEYLDYDYATGQDVVPKPIMSEGKV